MDSLSASGSRVLAAGHGLAQIFTPNDSLINSISIWTPAGRGSYPLHVWITQATADGRPDLDAVIADGGRLSPLGLHPARARYHAEFIPPISLPQRSRYAMVVTAEACGVLSVLTSHGARGPVGGLWETSVKGCPNESGAIRQRLSNESLLFRVEFCDVGTMAQGKTWGEIKTLYR